MSIKNILNAIQARPKSPCYFDSKKIFLKTHIAEIITEQKKFDRDCQVKLSLQPGLEAQKVEKH